MTTLSVSATAPTPARSFPRRGLLVFVSPGELFEELREHPGWVAPLLVATLATAAAVLFLPPELFLEEIRASGGSESLPTGQSLEQMARLAPVFGAVGVLLTVPLSTFAIAGVLLLVFSLLMGGDARYRQYLAVIAYASLIPALGALLTLPLQIARGDITLSLSLSLLAPFLDPDGIPFRILQAVDIFSLWWLVVIALGVHVLNRRPAWGTATLIVLAGYLLIVAGVVALSA